MGRQRRPFSLTHIIRQFGPAVKKSRKKEAQKQTAKLFFKKGLTKPGNSCIIMERSTLSGKTKEKQMERWLSWSKAHDWKSCNV